MYLVRVLCKKRIFFKFCVLICAIFCWQTFYLFNNEFQEMQSLKKFYKTEESRVFIHTRECNGSNSRLTSAADIFTYDLPDKTNYSFVKDKRFKEYVIPVHSESIAHAPHLDHVTVLLIPFSHVDPGYGNTMEGYYAHQTRNTLNYMVQKLHQYPNMTFQWAETVFLERWWRDIGDDVKNRARELVQRGQLEIVTGGWVMPDEASTHYVAVIDQLVEGHQWLIENLKVKPENSWSNDPFGFSSTMPYLWKKSGMENMVILRIHQAIKATLMKMKAMEFQWRQLWSKDPRNEILCHLMPYRGYWIGDTCGPYNQHICREYAFMHTEAIHKVVFVNKDNLEERARILYEQYRITAEIYRRHGEVGKDNGGAVKLYLPMFLGEDFSYTSGGDFDRIYDNYKLLMDYINAKTEWKMTFKYGTLKEYFSSLRQFQEERTKSDGSRFPTLAGDFFPYSDYQNDYWTGYYTTRPFNKQMSRELQSVLRMADIFHSYAVAKNRSLNHRYEAYVEVTSSLRSARRELGMFLHHDGITGTSVRHVTDDFTNRLWDSLSKSKSALEMIAGTIYELDKKQYLRSTTSRSSQMSVSVDDTFTFRAGTRVMCILNSSARKRTAIVNFLAAAPVEVVHEEQGKLTVEYRETSNPDMADKKSVHTSFQIEIPPFGIQPVTMKQVTDSNSVLFIKSVDEHKEDIVIENAYIRVEFDGVHGSLMAIIHKSIGSIRTNISTQIMKYTPRRSGAYIFAPSGEAKPYLTDFPKIAVSRGKLVSEVKVAYGEITIIYWINHIKGADGQCLFFKTELNMGAQNSEVILRLRTDIHNGDQFFTDQNGFQLLGRRMYPNRPIEQNYYPLTSMMIIEDDARRLTLHAGQPHGVASLQSGWMEVMLDRSVSRDDDKGLGQGVTDTKLTHAHFALQLETPDEQQKSRDYLYTRPSEAAIVINQILSDPLQTLMSKEMPESETLSLKTFSPVGKDLPCGVHVVSLRSLAKSNLEYNGTSLILHNIASHCAFVSSDIKCSSGDTNSVSLNTFFSELDIHSSKETSLTHLNAIKNVIKTENLIPEAMELRSFKVEF